MNDLQEAGTSSTLPPLPLSWVERLFKKFTLRYANAFLDQWKSFNPEEVKQAWAEELAGLTGNEIVAGLERAKTKFPSWPPKPLEFVQLCRPDPFEDWKEACEQMQIRLHGDGKDLWSRPEVYWAAVSIGWYDLNQTKWEHIKDRWVNALANARRSEIPEYHAALPRPGQATTSKEDASTPISSADLTSLRTVKSPEATRRAARTRRRIGFVKECAR